MSDRLNERDEMLLRLRAEGHTYNEIARRLAQRYGRHMTTLFVYRRLQELANQPLPEFKKEAPEPETPSVVNHSPLESAQAGALEVEAVSSTPPESSERPRDAKAYRARQTDEGARVFREDGRELDPRFDLREHSRDGFAWAQAGPQAAQLALAILADYLEDDARALDLYQDFKWNIVAWLPSDGWELTSARLDRFIEPPLPAE